MFDILGSDIVVMQELKIQRKDLRDDMVLIDGWDAYFSLPRHKKGYSGVAIYTRSAVCAPIRAEEGVLGVLPSAGHGNSGAPYCELPEDESVGGYPTALQIMELGVDPTALDSEGRCVILEFPAFVLFGIYSPANSSGTRDDFRHGFLRALDCRIRNLIKLGKNVVLVGDLNVSRDEGDTAGSIEDCRKNGISHSEYISTPNRRIFNQLLVGGEVIGERDEGREKGILWDTTRGFHPNRAGMYTHWETKINARPGNYGSRIDFVLVSETIRTWIMDANIQEGLLGSDHCPVFVDFHDTVRGAKEGKEEVKMVDTMNPPEVFEQGMRKREWDMQNAPAFSAKKLPEFDRRRSIKSMFAKPSVQKQESSHSQYVVDTVAEKKHEPSFKHKPMSAFPQIMTQQNAGEATILSQPDDSPKRQPLTSPRNLKRKVSTPVKEQPATRLKSDAAKGQQSLRGFFQAQDKKRVNGGGTSGRSEVSTKMESSGDVDDQAVMDEGGADDLVANGVVEDSHLPLSPANPQSSRADEDGALLPLRPPSTTSPSPSTTPSPTTITAHLAANEETQKSWSTIFRKPRSPLCETHAEPCKTMQTKKKGSNQGRSFWMCARPLGPSGEKERGTQWRCPTFIWCSDWDGRDEGGG